MTSTVKRETEEIKDSIECCICNEVSTVPRTLPCKHTFCLGCLQKIGLQKSKKPGQTFPCPVCRQEFVVPADGWTIVKKKVFMKKSEKIFMKESVETTRISKPPSPSQDVNKENDITLANGCQADSADKCREKNGCSRQVSQESRTAEKQSFREETLTNDRKVSNGTNGSSGASDPESLRDTEIALEKSQSTDEEDRVIRGSGDLRELDLQWQNFLRDVDETERAILTRQKELEDVVEMHARFLCEQLKLIKENGSKEMARQKQNLEEQIAKGKDANTVLPKTDVSITKSNGFWHDNGNPQSPAIDQNGSVIGLCGLEGELTAQKCEELDEKDKKDALYQLNQGNADYEQEQHSQPQQPSMPGQVSFNISEIQDFLTSNNILGQIKVAYPTELHHLVRMKIPTFVVCGLAKVNNHICILCQSPNIIRCYDDVDPYTLRKEVKIKQIKRPWDLTNGPDLNSLYVTDREKNYVWKVKLNDRRVTRWLSGIASPWTISASRSTGHILMVRSGPPSSLELYGPAANLIRCIRLTIDIESPLHAVETTTGNFIVSHKWRESRCWGVSELTTDGQTVNRFCPNGKAQELNNPINLTIDADDRVLVVDFYNYRIVRLESDLRWGQTLLREDTSDWAHVPLKLCYDRDKRQLVVGHDRLGGAVDIYRLL